MLFPLSRVSVCRNAGTTAVTVKILHMLIKPQRAWTHFSVEGRVQQHVAGLQVQVEERRGQSVEEVDPQRHVVHQSDDQRPRQGLTELVLWKIQAVLPW